MTELSHIEDKIMVEAWVAWSRRVLSLANFARDPWPQSQECRNARLAVRNAVNHTPFNPS